MSVSVSVAGQQHQHHVWASEKCSLSGPSSSLLNQNVCFIKILTSFRCTLKFDNCYLTSVKLHNIPMGFSALGLRPQVHSRCLLRSLAVCALSCKGLREERCPRLHLLHFLPHHISATTHILRSKSIKNVFPLKCLPLTLSQHTHTTLINFFFFRCCYQLLSSIYKASEWGGTLVKGVPFLSWRNKENLNYCTQIVVRREARREA